MSLKRGSSWSKAISSAHLHHRLRKPTSLPATIMTIHGLPVPLDSVDISGDFTSALTAQSQALTRGESRACILHQYIRQRRDCATDAKPSIVPRSLRTNSTSSTSSASSSAPSGSTSASAAAPSYTEDDEDNKAKLRVKTDSRRIYLPGQSVEAIIALDRQWFEAQQDAQDGFSHVQLSFGGVSSLFALQLRGYVLTLSILEKRRLHDFLRRGKRNGTKLQKGDQHPLQRCHHAQIT